MIDSNYCLRPLFLFTAADAEASEKRRLSIITVLKYANINTLLEQKSSIVSKKFPLN